MHILLLEGELDALCVQAYTGMAAVGYPGTERKQTTRRRRASDLLGK